MAAVAIIIGGIVAVIGVVYFAAFAGWDDFDNE